MSRYSIEIDCGGEECSSFEPRFASYDVISAEGDTLEELLETACVFITDQDGGELGEQAADAEWMQQALREAFEKRYCDPKSLSYDPPGSSAQSDSESADADREAARDSEVPHLNRKD